jgi:hypothetical protein
MFLLYVCKYVLSHAVAIPQNTLLVTVDIHTTLGFPLSFHLRRQGTQLPKYGDYNDLWRSKKLKEQPSADRLMFRKAYKITRICLHYKSHFTTWNRKRIKSCKALNTKDNYVRRLNECKKVCEITISRAFTGAFHLHQQTVPKVTSCFVQGTWRVQISTTRPAMNKWSHAPTPLYFFMAWFNYTQI